MTRFLVPIGVFLALVVFLGIGLTRDPSEVPSPLIGKAAPRFSLPAVTAPGQTLSLDDLKGQVSLLNVWASWCVACREEHPLLVAIAKSKAVPIFGLNYKDEPADAVRWLGQFGDPYVQSGSDIDGSVGLDLGVYGVPETFLLDANGHIAYKKIGPITETDWRETIEPLIAQLRNQ
ncbi:MAG: DsbE family thiol:disulfide interchange protein [Pseudomonadota bacterium]